MGGAWDRNLQLDLDAIEAWGAVVVTTLIEDHEFDRLQVKDVEGEIRRRHTQWMHLPIEDVSVPGAGFEATWADRAEGSRDHRPTRWCTLRRIGYPEVIHFQNRLEQYNHRAGCMPMMLSNVFMGSEETTFRLQLQIE